MTVVPGSTVTSCPSISRVGIDESLTIDLDPDTVTVYQMELPYNTVYSKDLLSGDSEAIPLADWKTKRAWHAYAFKQFAAAGYTRSSAYTMKKTPEARFVYRDAVWTGQDMIGAGVASFSHMNGVHYKNAPRWEDYLGTIDRGDLPLHRAFATNRDEQLIRELILQLKLGAIDSAYFRAKFAADIIDRFGPVFSGLRGENAVFL